MPVGEKQNSASDTGKAIDVAIVATRRPELLKRTLVSFQDKVFRNFEVRQAFLNLDPAMGSDEDGAECESVFLSCFPDGKIFKPEQAGFCEAVQRVWLATSADHVLHMEDDWIVLEDIFPGQVFPLFTAGVGAVTPINAHHGKTRNKRFHTSRQRIKLLGVPVWQKRISKFGTSPRFFDGNFMRSIALQLNLSLDPEKQMRGSFNPPLRQFLDKYDNRLIGSSAGGSLIEDIGRQWRDERAIEKKVVDGTSIWTGK